MTSRTWEHTEVCRVADLDGDPAAIGAAVTVAICGHWDHEGPCRWEHLTDTVADGDGLVTTVYFDAAPDEVPEVRGLIRAALADGPLTGPDGTTTTWRLMP